MAGELSTGVKALDRRLDGGLDPGDILAIVVPPATQIQTLLYQLMNERPTVYVSSLRPESSVKRDLEKFGGVDAPYRIETTGNKVTMEGDMIKELTGSRAYTGNTAVKDDPLDDLYDIVDTIDESVNVIVDPVDPFERGDSGAAYNDTLSYLSLRLEETGSLGVLVCHASERQTPFRDLSLIVADVVWELEMITTQSDDIEYRLRVPKNRGGEAIWEDLSLEIKDQTVSIDDTRSI